MEQVYVRRSECATTAPPAALLARRHPSPLAPFADLPGAAAALRGFGIGRLATPDLDSAADSDDDDSVGWNAAFVDHVDEHREDGDDGEGGYSAASSPSSARTDDAGGARGRSAAGRRATWAYGLDGADSGGGDDAVDDDGLVDSDADAADAAHLAAIGARGANELDVDFDSEASDHSSPPSSPVAVSVVQAEPGAARCAYWSVFHEPVGSAAAAAALELMKQSIAGPRASSSASRASSRPPASGPPAHVLPRLWSPNLRSTAASAAFYPFKLGSRRGKVLSEDPESPPPGQVRVHPESPPPCPFWRIKY